MMLLAVAQQEDEVPSVRREAIAALIPLLEDDTRKEEVLPAFVAPYPAYCTCMHYAVDGARLQTRHLDGYIVVC